MGELKVLEEKGGLGVNLIEARQGDRLGESRSAIQKIGVDLLCSYLMCM